MLLESCRHGQSYQTRLPCAACTKEERHFEDEHQRQLEEDWLSDHDHLTQVFPDGFSAPCERCGGPSLGDRYCPNCECELEP